MRRPDLNHDGYRYRGGNQPARSQRPPLVRQPVDTQRGSGRAGVVGRLPAMAEADRVLGVLTVLPEQLGTIRASSGEERLLLGVLEQAITCYQQHAAATDRRKQRLFREAEEWIMDPCVSATLTFGDVCDFLNLDPEYLRTKLARWREATARLRPPGGGTLRCDDGVGSSSFGALSTGNARS